jgi:hypothetical protein
MSMDYPGPVFTLSTQLLFLLMVANGAPILLHRWLGRRGGWPVDGGLQFVDRRPLFGPSKTYRGVLAAVLATGAAAIPIGLPWRIGLLIGGCAMLGDLLSSFLKRRLGLPSSAMALGLDQVPESLLPLLAVRGELALAFGQIAALVFIFLALELVLSRILYRLHIRNQPY